MGALELPPTTGNHPQGERQVDPVSGDEWICVKPGTPGTWVQLAVAGQSKGGKEGLVTGGNSGAAATIDLTAGNVVALTLTASCTLTFPTVANDGAYSFTLVLVQDGTGSRTVTWPAAVKWSGGTAPTLTATVAKRDVFTFVTYDGGATWLGFTAGQNFA